MSDGRGAAPDGLPPIRRARGYRLYAESGKRYVDLFQDAGRAVLGHRPLNLERTLKSAMSRGLYGALPTVHLGRLVKAVRSLLPGMAAYTVAGSPEAARSILAGLGFPGIEDPVRFGVPEAGHTGARCALWRPFSGVDYSRYAALLPVLPFPGSPLCVLCFRDPVAVPGAEPLPALYCAGLSRAAWDLVQALEAGRASEGNPDAPHFRLWQRSGIYLVPRYPESAHATVFREFLAGGFLVPPSFDKPAVLPGEWSDGEVAAFTGIEKTLAGRILDGNE